MGNTLTGLIPTIYAGLDVVSRELIGFIPNIQRDAQAQSGAVGQTVRSPVVPAISLENITPGATPASSGDQTFDYTDVTITKSKAAPIRWTGEEQLSVSRDGILNTILRDQFSQAFRALANEVEADLAALYNKASRAYGSPGAAFVTANDLSDLANMNRILDENGAPATGRVCIVGSLARANLEGKHSELFKVNEAGDAGAMLRQRQMRQLLGFTMGYSAGIVSHVAGTGTGYDINNGAGEVAGQTTLTLDGGTAGATGIKAGDVVSFAGDTNKYVVTTGLTTAAGDIVIGAPGLRATVADTVEMTIGGSYAANMAFSPNAMILAARTPAMPQGGDDADDVTTVTDPVSGLTFQIAVYRQYRQVKFEVGLAWGVKCLKPEHLALLIG